MARPTAQIAARRLRPKLTARVAERVDAYFRDFGRRLVPALEPALRPLVESSTKAEETVAVALRTFGWDGEARRFLSFVAPAIEVVGESAAAAVGSELGLDVSFDLYARQPVLTDVATRIRSIPETSRDLVRNLVDEGIAKGDSMEQLSRSMRGLVDSWSSTGSKGFAGLGAGRSSRSYLIALTETANAWNVSATESYAALGVDFVEVFDGPDCGWSSHDDPDLAHGSIRGVREARATPTSHPRCQRAFGARVDADGASPSPFARGGAVPGATPGIGAVDPLDAAALHLSGAGSAIPSRAVAEASQRAWEAARIAERDISRSLLRVVDGRLVSFDDAMLGIDASAGGDLAGFAARRKTLTSLSRKIATDQEVAGLANPPRLASADVFAKEIGDTVRYTVRFSEDEYWAGVRRATQELVDGGNVPVKWKPTWDSPIYRGLNTNWRAPNGTLFEVQFHTPTSFVTKELNHSAYDVARLLTTSAERRALLEAEMAARTAAVRVPPGEWVSIEEALALRPTISVVDDPLAALLRAEPGATDEVLALRAERDAIQAARYQASLTGTDAEWDALSTRLFAADKALVEAEQAAISKLLASLETVSEADAPKLLSRLLTLAGENRVEYNRLASLVTQEASDLRFLVRAKQTLLDDAIAVVKRRLPLESRILAERPGGAAGRVFDDALMFVRELEGIFPELRTVWNGTVKITNASSYAGQFSWSGELSITRDTLAYLVGAGGKTPADYYGVLLHEMFHSLSAGSKAGVYAYAKGWEEGVAEMATETFLGPLLARLGIAEGTKSWRAYQEFCAVLEDLRSGIRMEPETFYRRLLATPLSERKALVRRMIDQATDAAFDVEGRWQRLRKL